MQLSCYSFDIAITLLGGVHDETKDSDRVLSPCGLQSGNDRFGGGLVVLEQE